jgi:predicted DsbA family dithiol-disulfide isomerase
LIKIEIPSSVEIICENCFLQCKSLKSVTFESGSRLSRIE